MEEPSSETRPVMMESLLEIEFILKPSTEKKPDSAETLECCVCFLTQPLDDFFTSSTCGHAACRRCFFQHVSTMIRDVSVNIGCVDCSAALDESDILKLVADRSDLVEMFLTHRLNNFLFLHPESAVCPTPACGNAFLVPNKSSCPHQTCLNCRHDFCASCKVPWHEGQRCDEVLDTTGIKEWGKLYQRCPNCRVVVTRRQTFSECNHFKCKICRTGFCWICGKEFNLHHFFFGKCAAYSKPIFRNRCQYYTILFILFMFIPISIFNWQWVILTFIAMALVLTICVVFILPFVIANNIRQEYLNHMSIYAQALLTFVVVLFAWALLATLSPVIFVLQIPLIMYALLLRFPYQAFGPGGFLRDPIYRKEAKAELKNGPHLMA